MLRIHTHEGQEIFTMGDLDIQEILQEIKIKTGSYAQFRTSTNADFEEDSIGSLGTTEQGSYEEGITVGGKDINFRKATFGINFRSHFNFGSPSIIRDGMRELGRPE
jgi:hypothetical protein